MRELKTMVRAVLATILLLGISGAADAACTWEWLCDDAGNCEHVPVCENSLDLPPIEPLSMEPMVEPVVPPPIKPIPPIPPIGASECEQVRSCDFGGCVWKTVCF